jgi:hypothetical protein
MGYPAFSSDESFPSPEQWNLNPMKQPRWGLLDPWNEPLPPSGVQAAATALLDEGNTPVSLAKNAAIYAKIQALSGPFDAIVAARRGKDRLGRGGSRHALGRRAGLGQDTWDPSDFGQAFVPGTVPPPVPATAMSPSPAPSPIFQPAGLPANPSEALAQLTAQGQGPSGASGISPTLSLSQAQAQAQAQGMQLNSDGTLSPGASGASGIPTPWVVGGLLALLLLK